MIFAPLTGHSQGGILGRYWIKYLGGTGKVNLMVGVSPITHGTTLSGITTFAKALQVFYPAQPLFDKIAPSFYEMGKYIETSRGTVRELVVFFY